METHMAIQLVESHVFFQVGKQALFGSLQKLTTQLLDTTLQDTAFHS